MARANINSQYVVDVDAALEEKDTANNRHLYYWRVYHDRVAGSGGFWTSSPTQFGVEGPGFSDNNPRGYDFRNGVSRILLAEGRFWVSNNPDGSPVTFWVNASRSMANPPGGYAETGVQITTPSIPRASTATFNGGPSLIAGTPVRIDTNRASTAFTHALRVYFGDYADEFATGVGASFTWTPPMAMLEQIPNATSGKGNIVAVTYSGGREIGRKTTAFSLAVPASVLPTATAITVSENNPDVASLVGAFVQGLSLLKATVTGEGTYGSSIRSASFKLGDVTAPSGGAIPITESGNVPVTGSVVDSRGRTGTRAGQIGVLPYAPPDVTRCVISRCNPDRTPNNEGEHLRLDLTATVSSLLNETQRNAMTIRVFTRQKGATAWTARNVINTGLSYDSTAAGLLITGGGVFDVEKAWDWRVEVSDRFIGTAVQSLVATAAVFMHWGRGLGVGKFWEQGALDVAGQIYQSGQPVIDAASIRHVPSLPFAASAGIVTANHNSAAVVGIAVTLPAGRFTQPPMAFVNVAGSAGVSQKDTARVYAATPTALTIGLYTGDGTLPGGHTDTLQWFAVQMNEGNAAG